MLFVEDKGSSNVGAKNGLSIFCAGTVFLVCRPLRGSVSVKEPYAKFNIILFGVDDIEALFFGKREPAFEVYLHNPHVIGG